MKCRTIYDSVRKCHVDTNKLDHWFLSEEDEGSKYSLRKEAFPTEREVIRKTDENMIAQYELTVAPQSQIQFSQCVYPRLRG